jgi:adenylyltransferase/sulfurtransferase
MNDQELLRYSRQIMLPTVGFEGQQKIKQATCLIIGLGGLGSSASMYLASSGIGQLILCDFDNVEESNLQRQIVHTQQSIGKNKAESAKLSLQQLNPTLNIDVYNSRLTEQELTELAEKSDVIVDCTDNFDTRYLLNRVSLKTQRPLVSGAAIRTEGQLSVFNLNAQSPCYQCLYDDPSIQEDNNCSNNGVLAPLVGIVGSMQANETLKIIAQMGEPLDGKLYVLDSQTMQSRLINFSQDTACPHHS